MKEKEAEAAYRIILDITGTHTFPAATVGYGAQTAETVTITNTGNQLTGPLTVELSGTNAGSFTLSPSSINSIAVNETDTFTVVPHTGLAAGTYTAVVTVSGDNGISAGFTVSFTVNPSSPVYSIGLSKTDTYTFPAATVGYGAQTAETVTITNTGNQSTGSLTVGLSGANAGSFTLSTPTINSIAVGGTGAFTVVPHTGLAAGTYTAVVTVSGDNGISAGFMVSFTVDPGYTITTGTYTGGTVTANPTAAAAGTTVTLTVTPASGYVLQAGSLKVNNGAVTVSGSGPAYTFTMPQADVTVSAVFTWQFGITINGPEDEMPGITGVNSNSARSPQSDISYSAGETLTFTVDGSSYTYEAGTLKWYVAGQE
jgi:hypothetical protein